MQTLLPIESVISKKYKRTNGKKVWRENLYYAVYAADKIRSTIGPKGAYKMVTYNRGPEQVVKVTKDAIAILDELGIQYPPAVILAEAAKMQRDEAGDGVACFVVFLSSLLKKADELISAKIHPNTIVQGYSLATNKALEIIQRQATAYNGNSEMIFHTVDCQRGLLTPQICSMIKEAFASASCGGLFDKVAVRFLKKPGRVISESNLIRGVVIKKGKAHPNMPDTLKDLRIAVTSGRPGINRLELKMKRQGPVHMNLQAQTFNELENYRETENNFKLDSLNRLYELKANVLLCEQPLNEQLKSSLAAHGVFALETLTKNDTEAVVRATGAKPVGQLKDLCEDDLGKAEQLCVGKIELEKTVTINGCKGATFLLRGNTPQTIDELEAALKCSMTVLKILAADSRVLPGSGAVEAHLAQELKGYAKGFADKEQVVIDAYSDALIDIPRCIAENNGLNPTDTLLELRKRHVEGFCGFGVSEGGCQENVCFEPVGVKRSVLRRAYEVSMLMLKIDELLLSTEIAKFHKK